MAQVKIIAPQTREAEHLRVAAYCRVSSDSKDQLHSYAAQIRSYTEEIAQHDGWELVDVYADEGLTGTRMDRREDFNRMMADCRKGKIDRILVKSVSRFARNTRDCLSALRELSTMGVSVRFEKENIDTKTLTTELMVSVSGSLAQQESISISANQKMSYQRRMERGEFITCTAPYGYRIVNKKDLEIVPEEAATVRWIFDAYLKGRSSGWIAEQLTAKGIPSQSGAECWRETGVRYLLTNEKYIGDALSQKSYSCGFPFVQKRNHGERLQYYTENSHPAIIDRDTFERVQALLQKKAQKEKKRREKSPLALKIVCGNCGTVFQRRSSQNGYVTWVCRTHDRHAADCPVGRIPETEIHAAFLRMYHRLKSNADIILAPALRQLNTLGTILRQNHPQVLAINRAIAEATEESHKISTLRANGLLDADICAARMNAISARLAQLRGEQRRLTENEAIDETMDALRKVEQTLLNGPERLDGFDEELFERLVEKIIAESQNRIRFRLYGGLELTEQWEGGGGKMINRKVLYGYQIQNGTLEIVPEEQRTVSMVFTLYNAGASYQAISDALNRQGVPYCREVPLWNKHKVKRLLENPRYTGKEGYPILVEADIFQAAQEKTAEKNTRKQSHGEKSAIARLTPYFRCTCGGKMTRLGGGWQNSGKLYLRCEGCGNTAVMDMDATVNGIVRQFRNHEQPSCTAYTPSAEVMRLDNAINRGLEQPDSPEAVMALILQGAAARYACCPEPSAESEPSDSLTEADWRRFQRAVSHITISQDTEVTLIFTDKKATGKDE